MKKPTKWMSSIFVVMLLLPVLPFWAGCVIRVILDRIPNQLVLEYEEYGLNAWKGNIHGRIIGMNILHFNLWEGSSVTSIVCRVNGVDYVAYDKQNPSRQSVRAIKSYEKDLGEVTTLSSDGPGTIFWFCEDPLKHPRNMCSISQAWSTVLTNRHRVQGVPTIYISNYSSNIVVHVRMNDIEFDVPCSREDFIRALGDGYEEYKIVYR